MTKAKRDRVSAGGDRQLIDEALDGRRVRHPAKTAQAARAKWRRFDPVRRDSVMGERVIRNRIPVTTDAPHGRLWPWWINELARKESAWLATRSGAMRWRPDVVVPGDDLTRGTEAAAHTREHGWPLGLPGELFSAAPLDANRTSDRLREEGRIGADVVGAVVTVASRSLSVDDADVPDIESKQGRKRRPKRKHVLRARIDGRAIWPDIRNRARRSHRRMRLRGERIRRFQSPRRPPECPVDVSHAGRIDRLLRHLQHERVMPPLIGQGGRRRPGHAQ